MKTRAKVKISGCVQGVGFRYYTRRQAKALQLTGWVRNLPNGDVEALFEGESQSVEAMLGWCRQGPPAAAVQHVGCERGEYSGQFSDFEVLR